MASAEPPMDLVDLTISPDDPPARKRRRSPDGMIDLAAEEEAGGEGGAAAAAVEAAARRRIMEHARRVNQERGLGSGGSAQAVNHQQQQAAGDADGSTGGALNSGKGPPQAAAALDAPPTQATPVSNNLLAQLHAERMARQAQRQQAAGGGAELTPSRPQQHHHQPPKQQQQQHRPQQPPPQQQQQQQQHHHQQAPPADGPASVSLLTWNVWFREDIHVQARMAAIGAVIQERRPHFVCLQEVTPLIYQLFGSSPWWPAYHASPCPSNAPYFTLLLWNRSSVQGAGGYAEIPYENSVMGRDLKTVAGKVAGRSIRVATTHLESPTGWDRPFREARQAQLKQAGAVLDQAREEDVLLAGDMNWSPDDGVPPLPGGWSDAHVHLHGGSGEQEGLTYDPRANPMLKKTNRLRRRLDRVFCKLRRWRLATLELVGRQALPGLQFEGRPVLPSDHFGLLLELRPLV